MSMSASPFADTLKEALGKKDSKTSKETKGLCAAVINETSIAVVSNIPGTVLGTVPSSGGELLDGAATNGLAVGMTPATLAANMALEMGFGAVSPQLLTMATAICTRCGLANIVFKAKSITGTCSNSASSPGVLTGEGKGGQVTELDADALAKLMSVAYGGKISDELKDFCKAFVDYIEKNAEVTYVLPTVTGVCSAGGGVLGAGVATGGKIA